MKLQKTKRAFTLIELMIVIAIIGLLAVSLFPQLQGAQERSRDAARLSNIKNVVAVLETYYYDEGVYPTNPHDNTDMTNNGDGCLSGDGGSVADDLADLFKGRKAPVDPQVNNISGDCSGGKIGYYSLTKDGINSNGYVLITNVETEKKANFLWDISIAEDGTTESTIITDDLNPSDVGTGTESVYVETN